LKYFFTQKAPSQRLLRLCEFLADYNFTEIGYVPGPENVVPDFLSRPWESRLPLSPINMLVMCSHVKDSSLWGLQLCPTPSVLVLPVWKGQVAVQERDGASGLWAAEVQTGAVAMELARQAILSILTDSSEPCVARTGNVKFWRADFSEGSRMGGGASVIPYEWRRTEEMSDRNAWHRPHFESLGHFGVWSWGGVGSIFPARRGPVLQSGGYLTSLQTTAEQLPLTDDIKLAVPTDGFLNGVLESVKDSDNNFFRNFFLDSNEVLCYQRPEDVQARVCVPGASREAVLRAAHGDSVLAGHPWH